MGDFRAAGIRHRKCRYATKQPGCPAQRHRHLVLQRRWLALGQAGLSRHYWPRRSWRHAWKHDPSQPVSRGPSVSFRTFAVLAALLLATQSIFAANITAKDW